MSRLKSNFGKRVQNLRVRACLTQEDVAFKIGLTVESVSNMERGVYGVRFDTLEKLAEILKVEVKELFEFNDE